MAFDAGIESTQVSLDIEILRNAKAVIGEKGWCQNHCVNDFGQRCAVGAIGLWGPQPNSMVWSTLREIIDPEGKMNPLSIIPEWNDAPGRTQAEVLELFDLAIERLENGV